MKYFTDELWSKMNSKLIDERTKADIDWENNLKIIKKIMKIPVTQLNMIYGLKNQMMDIIQIHLSLAF